MARVPSKHGRDQALDFQGFLNDLQDWELSLKDKDKKQKSQVVNREKVSSSQKVEKVGENRRLMTGAPSSDNSSTTRQYDYLKNYDSIRHLSSGLKTEESSPNAASEKELGNEYFKQKKFKEAIDCYSRSIALSPTAVAYANRAMAYIKVRRFQEAEDDCTEALNLDDRYIKAYSRRSTARKELGKLKESMDDAEFALRLEPHNQELKKQHAEVKALYEKELLERASRALKKPVQGEQNARRSKLETNGNTGMIQSVSSGSQRTGTAAIQEDRTKNIDGQDHVKEDISGFKVEKKILRAEQQESNAFREDVVQSTESERIKNNNKPGKQQIKASVQDLAARAASLAKTEAANHITPPNSAYQFEASWRRLSGEHSLQARLLKVTSPAALPQIFKNALSASLLIDIIRCIATFFNEETDLAVRYLENLTNISRFDMIIMCLSSTDKGDLLRMWNEVFCSNATPMEYAERLDKLRPRYCIKQ